MKTTSLHIAFVALLSLLLLASCSRNDEVAVAEGEEGKVYVTLTLSINGEEVGSRADWLPEQNTDQPGVGWENEINDLQILIYDDADEYVGTVEDLFASKSQYVGTLSGTNWQSGTYKFVVLANFTASNTKLADLAAITYNQNAEYIPMWGVLKSNFTFAAGKRTDIGSIDLLRAMAKVEVSFSDDFPTDEYTIGDITLSPYNTQGYCVPAGYASVETTGALDREEAGTAYSFNPLAASASTSSLTFTEENGKYYIYLPEYENTETNAAKIKVTVNGETYELEFKDYENGAPKEGTQYDIVRNHIYRYTITGVNDGKLKLEYRVLLWDKVESAIGWNPEIKDGGNAPVSAWRLVKFYKDKDEPRYIDSDYKDAREGDEEAVFCYVLYPRYDGEKDSDGNAKHEGLENKPSYAAFNFHLSEPKGAVWKAWLSNTTDFSFGSGDYTVTDVKKDENGEDMKDENGNKIPGETHTRRCVITGIAREEDYQIQVTANNPWTDLNYQNTSWGQGIEDSKKEVYTDLHISISTDNGKTWHDLAINKKDEYKQDDGSDYLEHTYWIDQRRFAGGHDNYIRIWQLKPVKDKGFDVLIKDLPSTHSIKRWWKGDDSN